MKKRIPETPATTQDEREARWECLLAYGAEAMKRAGIRSDEELQAVLYEMRHGQKHDGQ